MSDDSDIEKGIDEEEDSPENSFEVYAEQNGVYAVSLFVTVISLLLWIILSVILEFIHDPPLGLRRAVVASGIIFAVFLSYLFTWANFRRDVCSLLSKLNPVTLAHNLVWVLYENQILKLCVVLFLSLYIGISVAFYIVPA